MQLATRIAHRLQLDPVLVMDEPDRYRYAVRWAAAQYLSTEERREREQAERERQRR